MLIMMNPEIKVKWLEALRSRKFEQRQGVLRCNGSFCCLGILCDIVAPELWDLEDEASQWYTLNGRGGSLSSSLKERVGIDDIISGTLINLNDREGKSFTEIANWIEANL
jgi:hypothetical protein